MIKTFALDTSYSRPRFGPTFFLLVVVFDVPAFAGLNPCAIARSTIVYDLQLVRRIRKQQNSVGPFSRNYFYKILIFPAELESIRLNARVEAGKERTHLRGEGS
jgi:hypothetical protein